MSDAPAPSGYHPLAPLTVKSGKGCGVFGTEGSRRDAERLLRDKAVALQASYVRITEYRKPALNHQCQEHEHVLTGIAYRKASTASAPAPSTTAPPPAPPRAGPQVLLDYEGNAALGRPAPATATSTVSLTLGVGETSPSALSVTFTCSGDDQRANLDVWNESRIGDWRSVSGISFRVKPDTGVALSVSFIDGNGAGYTQVTQPLTPGVWQVVALPLDKFSRNPFGPPGDQPRAAVDTARVSAFGFAPQGCTNGHFLIDDIVLVR